MSKNHTQKQFDLNAVLAALREGLQAGYTANEGRKVAKAATVTMSQHVLNAAKLCKTAAVFEDSMEKFGTWLKEEKGQAWCKENGVAISISGKTGRPNLPQTFRSYTSTILRGMRLHEDKAIRDDKGQPLVPGIETFDSETEVRKAVSAQPVRDAEALAAVHTATDLTDDDRTAAAHEVMVGTSLRNNIASIQRMVSGLKGDRLDKAHAATVEALKVISALDTEQRAEDNARKQAADSLPEGSAPAAGNGVQAVA